MQTIEFERHAPAMDMFSLGVLLFVMLTGSKPMKSEQARKLSYSKLEASEYPKMQNWGWKQLSQPAKTLVLQLMERDPAIRITAAQACSHRCHYNRCRIACPVLMVSSVTVQVHDFRMYLHSVSYLPSILSTLVRSFGSVESRKTVPQRTNCCVGGHMVLCVSAHDSFGKGIETVASILHLSPSPFLNLLAERLMCAVCYVSGPSAQLYIGPKPQPFFVLTVLASLWGLLMDLRYRLVV